MKYDCLIIDTVNLAYKVFNTSQEKPLLINKKSVYKESVVNFIKMVDNLKERFLHFDGIIYLLIDNYYSRADLQTSFMYADRRELSEAYKFTRHKESKEFYNSINLIRYYYMINTPQYVVSRIDGLEADDLVKPILDLKCKDKKCLFVTSDLDWTRYLSDSNHWLPKLGEEPETAKQLEARLGFPISETSIIAFKSIFGDASDNISSLVTLNKNNLSQFAEIIKNVAQPLDIIELARNNMKFDFENPKKYSLLAEIYSKERQYLINTQLTSAIPCDPKFLEENTIQGRDDKTLMKILKEILGIEQQKKKYKFGGIKRPRVVGR